MKPLNTQPYQFKPPMSATAAGSTVATANASNAAMDTVRINPIVRLRRAGPQITPAIESESADESRSPL